MWQYRHTDELAHHGIKGQKWGVRRYQNPDGSLTAAGKKHYKFLNSVYDSGGDIIEENDAVLLTITSSNNPRSPSGSVNRLTTTVTDWNNDYYKTLGTDSATALIKTGQVYKNYYITKNQIVAASDKEARKIALDAFKNKDVRKALIDYYVEQEKPFYADRKEIMEEAKYRTKRLLEDDASGLMYLLKSEEVETLNKVFADKLKDKGYNAYKGNHLTSHQMYIIDPDENVKLYKSVKEEPEKIKKALAYMYAGFEDLKIQDIDKNLVKGKALYDNLLKARKEYDNKTLSDEIKSWYIADDISWKIKTYGADVSYEELFGKNNRVKFTQ